MLLLENIPLAPLTTIKIGGPARYFVEAKSVGDTQEAVTFARSRDLPLFVLGGGSYLGIAVAGWRGLGLNIAISGLDRQSACTMKTARLFSKWALENPGTNSSHAP